MQQKTMRFLLVVGVLFVWGAILFKVFGALDQQPSEAASPMNPLMPPVATEQMDTFTLLENYSDPFLPNEPDAEADSIITSEYEEIKLPAVAAQPVQHATDISFIKYFGMIANPAKKIKTAIVSIRGQEAVLKEGAQMEEVRLKRITPDNIEILYKGKTFNIHR